MIKGSGYWQRCKQVTNFIRMHLSHNNLEQFVPNISKYKPKLLWDSIVTHFAEKTVENSANALDCLFDTQFIEGNMDKCVKNFQASFRQLTEVSSNFNKKSLKKASSHFHRVSTTPVCKLQRWWHQFWLLFKGTGTRSLSKKWSSSPIGGFFQSPGNFSIQPRQLFRCQEGGKWSGCQNGQHNTSATFHQPPPQSSAQMVILYPFLALQLPYQQPSVLYICPWPISHPVFWILSSH